MWNFILPIATAFFAVLQLAKDWGGHKTHWRRAAVLTLILLLAVGSAFNNYYTGRRTSSQHLQDQAEITGLKTAVETANSNQEANTRLFIDAFGKLSQKVSDLQTGVATEALQKRLASVQVELQNTQRALAPAPKARLLFTFLPFKSGTLGGAPTVPATDVSLPLNLGDTIHFEFTVLNLTEADAMDGQYSLLICELCGFAKEPQGFTKLEGRPETERYTNFVKIPAMSQGPMVGKIEMSVPQGMSSVEVGIVYRCHTCELSQSLDGLRGTIHILR